MFSFLERCFRHEVIYWADYIQTTKYRKKGALYFLFRNVGDKMQNVNSNEHFIEEKQKTKNLKNTDFKVNIKSGVSSMIGRRRVITYKGRNVLWGILSIY